MRPYSGALASLFLLAFWNSPSALCDWQTVSTGVLDANFAADLEVAPDGSLYSLGLTYREGNYFTWIISNSRDGGATWQQVDRYLAEGDLGNAEPSFLFFTSAGDLFEGGSVTLNNELTHWILRKRTRSGAFEVVDDYTASGPTQELGAAAMAEDSIGQLYVLGTTGAGPRTDGPYPSSGLLRISQDDGKNWQNLSPLPTEPQAACVATALAIDWEDQIYAAQSCLPGQLPFRMWTELYVSRDYGNTWQLLDQVNGGTTSGRLPEVSGIVTSVFGDLVYQISAPAWTIRRLDSRSGVWATVDYINSHGSYGDETSSIFSDWATGEIWASGTLDQNNGIWTVRKSSDGGKTWSPSDAFQAKAGQTSEAGAIAKDNLGNLYVYGTINRSQPLLRKLAGP